ncbi:hypothetical protein [Campylobacter rectus]|uniref:hypothetical protein n=1 Tax=Campylobacter rectus TaxID=203 RepID=UPI0028DBF8E5|nr:hypothetical protein [Campylobacter rectus]
MFAKASTILKIVSCACDCERSEVENAAPWLFAFKFEVKFANLSFMSFRTAKNQILVSNLRQSKSDKFVPVLNGNQILDEMIKFCGF